MAKRLKNGKLLAGLIITMIQEAGFNGIRDSIKVEGAAMTLDKLDDGGDVSVLQVDGRGHFLNDTKKKEFGM